MNIKMIIKSLGSLLFIEAACMLPSLLVSLIYRQNDSIAFILSILIIFFAGLIMYQVKPNRSKIYAGDGFAIVGFGWILISLFGALPFILSGAIPSVVDAIFESVSGFSTTGASIIRNVEILPRGILFWRSFTHWIGGMGVLVLLIAVFPSVKADTLHILKAESPGPSPEKLVPKIGKAAKLLYIIYIALTFIQVIFLLFGGMPLFDSLIHAFGTAGTGGFSCMNASISAYNSAYIEMVIMIFMLLFGVNFTLYYLILKGNIKSVFCDEEFRFYIGTFLTAVLLISANTYVNTFHSVWKTIRYSTFQVSSIMTTTGYMSTDFNLWPVFSKFILVLLMFIGASAGSTGGGIKCIRIMILFKIIKREIIKIIHPRSVYTVKVNGKVVNEDTLSSILSYFFVYIFLFVLSVLLVLLDGKDFISSSTAVASAIGNIGPGLGIVGPIGNYADFSVFSKLILSFCMIIGRLEVYPILILFVPTFWKVDK